MNPDVRIPSILSALALLTACAPAATSRAGVSAGSDRLLIHAWAADADSVESDFLAVIDATPGSPTFASVIATAPTGERGAVPHHTEHELGASRELWANGFGAGRTYRFDLRDAERPRLLGAFGAAGGFEHPHSYARLPNGHVLATFQHRAVPGHHAAEMQSGGLVEFDGTGRLVRSASAAAPEVDPGIRPYSLAVLPALDRVVTTSTDMHLGTRSAAVQVWRLSDLRLLHTILMPPGRRGTEHELTAEPRVLADGRTVLVNTFTCGLYLIRGLEGEAPSGQWVHSGEFSGSPPFCSVPVVTGRYWLQPSGPERAIITLDVSDPGRPREVSRLALAPDEIPHWLGRDATGTRVVLTGYGALASRVLLLTVDPLTGSVRLDSTFRSPGAERPGVDFALASLPHGPSGRAIPHGAVFSRR